MNKASEYVNMRLDDFLKSEPSKIDTSAYFYWNVLLSELRTIKSLLIESDASKENHK